MSGARAKRILLRWARYVGRQPDRCGPRRGRKMGPAYSGHSLAYQRASCVGRRFPYGIREPWVQLASGLPPRR